MKFVRGNDAEFVLPSKIEIVFRIDLPAQADLQNAAFEQQSLFDRPPNRSAVRMRTAEISAPRIVVGVELDQRNRPKLRWMERKMGSRME